MQCLYIKIFENGCMYVGCTQDFEIRMKQHEWNKNNGSNLPVHKAMREFRHITKVLVEDIDDRELLYELELETIKILKDKKITLYNMTSGGKGTLKRTCTNETRKKISESHKGKKYPNISKSRIGSKNPRFKPKEFYENKKTTRNSFKRICKNQNWNFNDFDEIWKGDKNKYYQKEFYYIFKK